MSRKFKILAIHDVLAHGKSYEHGFTKKYDGHKLCAESSFDRFFMHRLRNSKYWTFQSYKPMDSRTSTLSKKNTTVINFARSRALSRVSIGFLCTVSEIQNTGHSRCISPW
ncbi:hypothetical protein GW17_00061349 [Ensete ventricosum]|nr:hypothetical protein GW17_00061349 [Ensete ventricosum]